jgi:hypothetical protein
MKFRFILLILFFISTECSSRKMPGTIPMGRWEYKLMINGVTVGSAVISNSQNEKHYISETEMKMKVGKITNISHQVVTETKEFKPVKLEINNSINFNNTSQKIITTAVFKEKTIELVSLGTRSKINVNEPFVIDGNYFISKLIKNNFKEGYSVSSLIYEPSMEPDETIGVTVSVVGIETVDTGEKSIELIHIIQSIDNFKSVDIYINFDGIMEKAIIKMLNNRIELVRN